VNESFGSSLLFPVEGDTAVVELLHDDRTWADMRLEGIDLAARGEQRVAAARVVVRLYPAQPQRPSWREAWPGRGDFMAQHLGLGLLGRIQWARAMRSPTEGPEWWEFDLVEVSAQLEAAREMLLDNERGREPIDDAEGLSAMGSAYAKMSREHQREWSVSEAEEDDAEEEA
jgi:hypothetical protein